MRRLRWLSPFLVICLAGGVLAACGDDDDSSDTASGGSSSSEDSGGGITVTMKDYSFSTSGKLTAGEPITVKNDGNELHMMAIGKLKAGATLAQLQDALAKSDPNAQSDPTEQFIEQDPEIGWPGGFVTPGHSVTMSADGLSTGQYAMVCFIPTEGGGPPHFAQGMINQLDVVSGSAEEADEADATYELTAGKPLEGPSSLDAGKRTIEITGSGDIGKLEPQLVKAQSADQTPTEINDAIDKAFGEFESESGPSKGAGKKVAEYIAFAGFDLNANKSVTFTYDFEPGTYYLGAPDTDEEDENAPSKPPTELIKITVK